MNYYLLLLLLLLLLLYDRWLECYITVVAIHLLITLITSSSMQRGFILIWSLVLVFVFLWERRVGLLGPGRRQLRRLNTNCYFRKSLHLFRYTADKIHWCCRSYSYLVRTNCFLREFPSLLQLRMSGYDRKNFYKNSCVV